MESKALSVKELHPDRLKFREVGHGHESDPDLREPPQGLGSGRQALSCKEPELVREDNFFGESERAGASNRGSGKGPIGHREVICWRSDHKHPTVHSERPNLPGHTATHQVDHER